ncbi:spindle pole body interacting protein [Auricularia subglabra TFB-10046 SS5]|uniref:Spindle pole body interacting protein n=1 Tax=Auricularia subglabra (strain TFB-10046 / SS5) TaxID=717982 RepID=J0D0L1_AURST|nr:spindle pole body interacting protein [Auricularia subglabra TFB-10046 SS5]
MGRRKNVSYVLLAEFDIDVGTTLSRQLPWPTGVDPQLLAELMLPEGVHDVEQDWTVFMLNQTAENTCDIIIEASSEEEEEDDNSDSGSGSKQQPILHVLNLVFRKFDSTAKRKWVVKALAICTHHPYIQIFKPVLLVALQAYFDEPSEACLNRLYEAVTAMDIAFAPTLSRYERLIMRQMERRDLFAEKQQPPQGNGGTGNPTRSVESFEHTRSRTSSMMSGSTDVDGETASTDSNHKVGMTLGEKDYRYYYTSIKYASRPPAPPVVLPVKVPLASFPEDVGEYSLVSLIQTFSGPNAQVSGPIHAQLHTNGNLTHPIIVLFNALITQKRVIFLGTRAGHVSEYVLAACALASGCGTVLRGFVERAFPYAHLALCDTVMQNVPGYIAGVTNPIFEQKDWWDLLCNTTTGKMTVHKNINAAPPPLAHFPSVPSTPLPGLPRQDSMASQDDDGGKQAKAREDHPDNIFMDEILLMIQQHHGESNVRQRFTEYVQRFVRMAARYEEDQFRHTDIGFRSASFSPSTSALGSGVVPVDPASWNKELNANASRIEGWRKTRSYEYYATDFAAQMEHSQFRGVDITHQLARLLFLRSVQAAEAEAIARTFAQVCGDGGYEAAVELLAHLPASRGGLAPLAFGLFSQVEGVRASTVELLNRLRNWDVGRVFIRLLNHFQRYAYIRLAAQQLQQQQPQVPQLLPASLSAPNIAMARLPSNHSQSSLGHS